MKKYLQRIQNLAVVIITLAAITQAATADTIFITGKVTRITDGDSLHLTHRNQDRIVVRAAFYDSPELEQPYGIESRDALRGFILGQTVQAGCHKKDRYGRLVCVVYYGTVDVNHLMIKAGFGHFYRAYAHELSLVDRQRYSAAENEARRSAAGLWGNTNVIAPWDFRKRK